MNYYVENMEINVYKYDIPLKVPAWYFDLFIDRARGYIFECSLHNKKYYVEYPSNPEFCSQFDIQLLIELIQKSIISNVADDTILNHPILNDYPQLYFPLWSLINNINNTNSDIEIKLAYFYNDTNSNFKDNIIKIANDNYTVIKLKKDIFLNHYNEIDDISEKLAVKFRIDFNQSANITDLSSIFSNIKPSSIDFIEEPFSNPKDLKRFKQMFDFQIALDETIIQSKLDEFEDTDYDIVSIKPSLVFNFENIIVNALSKGKRIILSSAYESSIGVSHIMKLASKYNLNEYMGLDTTKFFVEDLSDLLIYRSNSIILNPNFNIDYNQLKRIF